MDLKDDDKPFIWRKKYEELGIKINEKELEAEIRKKAEENKAEREKIRERQNRKLLESQQKKNDNEFLQRQIEAEQYKHWEQQEDDFVLRQHRQRSKIRIRDGRAKPIDLLAHYIDVFGVKAEDSKKHDTAYVQEEKIDLSDSPIELLNPCDWFKGLTHRDLVALESDINMYLNADCENERYWRDLLEITKNGLNEFESIEEQARIKASGSSDINSAVVSDVLSIFEGKTISELDDMEDEMTEIIRCDDPSIDTAFYHSALSRLRAHRAKLRLSQDHKKNLKRQKDKILDKPDEKPIINEPSCDITNQKTKEKSNKDTDSVEETIGDEEEEEEEELDEDSDGPNDKFEEARRRCTKEYREGGYSPKMYRKNQLDPGTVCLDYEKEYELLTHHRNQICNASTLDEAKLATMSSEEAFLYAASKGMDNREESTFSCEAAIRGPNNRAMTYAWADKYQPRKPRYFNRVHTGFEWNKYNQTHYDIDNPPPKQVQGYKFNIFYPDLIDKSKAPTFTRIPCEDDKDFCILRFSAGPPYEDIAFKIVNGDWNNSHKSGYRSQFINNMLQLWFQFKRKKYRR